MNRALMFFVFGCFVISSAVGTCFAGDRVLLPGKTDALSSRVLGPMKSDFMTPDELGLAYEESFVSNTSGEQLRLWSIPAASAKQTILFCMGNQGNISSHLVYAKLLTEGGFSVLMFDYQGYGKSSGDSSVLTLLSDANCVAEYLTNEKQQNPSDIGCFGVSLGSALAVAVAAKYDFGAVAVEDILLPTRQLDKVAAYLPNDIASMLALATVRNVILPQVDPLLTAKRLRCPILILHGELDGLLPPSGAVELAGAVTGPKRIWLMEGSGHAPETLEIHDGEYGHQLTSFFRQAFGEDLIEPKISMTAIQDGEQWQVDVQMDCELEGCYQVAVASKLGECHFVRQIVENRSNLSLKIPFEPVHVSALLIQHAKRLDDLSWEPATTTRTQSLKEFRNFEQRWRSVCPPQRQFALFYGTLRPVSYRDPSDMKWLADNLPDATLVHPDVRPRYARLAASAFGEMLANSQDSQVQFIERLLPFLPENPDSYYQLENASFQLQLRDERLAGAILLLSKFKYHQGELDQAKQLLRIASSITNQTWPKIESIEKLKSGVDFFEFIGSPFGSTQR
ncbi:MAG: alpha/beta hydrolase [Planctomycetales bacterium]|nr:alpha/beta hydrolase [Planctomycetales bacterium]